MYSRLRQIFIVVLLCSNLALGFLSYGLLREMNSGYASLVGQSIPILAKLHEITLGVMRAYRSAALAASAPTPEARKAEYERAVSFQEGATKIRLQYQRSPDLINGDGIDWPVEKAAREYEERFQHYLEMVRKGDLDQASAYRTSTLWPAADQYYEILELRVTQLDEQASKLNQGYAASHSVWRNVVLTLGSWPIALAAALILVMGGTILALLVAVFFPRLRREKSA